MPIKQHNISVTKTARFFQLGELNSSTTDVIIACHGYAQLANYFLRWFEPFQLENTVIIAPEGLSRFYWDGFSGNVVASWMTKVDRETDIMDYTNYLDEVVNSLNLDDRIKITALGFSQGGATVCRWVSQSTHNIKNLILWATVFPEDITLSSLKTKLKSPIQILFGDNDQFYNMEQIVEIKTELLRLENTIVFTTFKGSHKIYPEPLNNLFKKLQLS